MTAPLKVAVTGCTGRMGRTVLECVSEREGMVVSGALERPGHPLIGKPLEPYAVQITDSVRSVCEGADVIIDFSSPKATLQVADVASATQTALVVGTTGFSTSDFEQLRIHAASIPLLQAGNMSLGVNMMTILTQHVAKALGDDFDIEVIEAHHNQKVDAPSGTALMLGEAAAQGRGVALEKVSETAREGITGTRKKGAIGFSVIRGGDIVGEHDVLFAGLGERLVLRHIATDRNIFGRGAVHAAQWIATQSNGFYSMQDVLGL